MPTRPVARCRRGGASQRSSSSRCARDHPAPASTSSARRSYQERCPAQRISGAGDRMRASSPSARASDGPKSVPSASVATSPPSRSRRTSGAMESRNRPASAARSSGALERSRIVDGTRTRSRVRGRPCSAAAQRTMCSSRGRTWAVTSTSTAPKNWPRKLSGSKSTPRCSGHARSSAGCVHPEGPMRITSPPPHRAGSRPRPPPRPMRLRRLGSPLEGPHRSPLGPPRSEHQ